MICKARVPVSSIGLIFGFTYKNYRFFYDPLAREMFPWKPLDSLGVPSAQHTSRRTEAISYPPSLIRRLINPSGKSGTAQVHFSASGAGKCSAATQARETCSDMWTKRRRESGHFLNTLDSRLRGSD